VSVLVRLVLLSGAAAAISLMVREPLARRVTARIVPGVGQLAEASRRLAPPARMLPLLPSSAASIVPLLPPSPVYAPIVAVPLPHKKVAKAAASASVSTITRKQVEDAIASRLDGARAALVRDEAGHPLGLRLSGVGRLAPYGVRDGDVLVSANGMPLRTPEESLAALGKLQDAKRVVVVLRRGSATYAIPVELTE
jgi:hypothetical protein